MHALAVRTEPGDLEAAREVVKALYHRKGAGEPAIKICRSPMAAVLDAAELYKKVVDIPRIHFIQQIEVETGVSLEADSFLPPADEPLWYWARRILFDTPSFDHWTHTTDQGSWSRQETNLTHSMTTYARRWRRWAEWPAGWQCIQEKGLRGGYYRQAQTGLFDYGMEGLVNLYQMSEREASELRQFAFLYRLFSHVAYIIDFPTAIHFDAADRLSQDPYAPAVEFSDGSGATFLHGVMVPRITGRMTGKKVDRYTHNVEVRRVLREWYGTEKYLEETGAELFQSDGYGDLYRREKSGDDWTPRWQREHETEEPLVMVRVVNSTPEPDGSYKDYFLRVPPNIRTAHEAVAWTFGMTAEEYDPVIQT